MKRPAVTRPAWWYWRERKYWMQHWAYHHLGIQHPWDFVAKHMPQSLRYWVLIREGSKHIGGSAHPHEVIPEVPFTVVLERCSKVGAGAR